jgi:uncharacterized protein (TIGR03435 family)
MAVQERATRSGIPIAGRICDLLFEAYGLRYYDQQIAGPGWIDTEEYDIVAKMPPGTTKVQFFRQALAWCASHPMPSTISAFRR